MSSYYIDNSLACWKIEGKNRSPLWLKAFSIEDLDKKIKLQGLPKEVEDALLTNREYNLENAYWQPYYTSPLV